MSRCLIHHPGITPILYRHRSRRIGVYLRAGYLGQYTGSYTANGVSQEVKSSGFRLFDLGQPTGTVSAVFEKADDAVKHNLTVEIWENGRLLASNGTNAAYGTVSVSANV